MLNQNEILKVADIVSQEKGIELDIVMQAMEESFEIIAKSKYGLENNIKAVIDRFTGNFKLTHIKDVVETFDPVLQSNQILLEQAKKHDAEASIGSQIHIELPAVSFGRVTANMARQVIYTRVREAEKKRQFNDYKDKVGEVLSGIVKRIEFGNIIVDLGKAEGFLRKDELIPRENFKNGDRIRAYFFDIKEEVKGHQISLSRTHPQFMAKLFVQEVPEIYEGQIEIMSVARDPGSRGKITVRANDKSIDPVGACVGMRGSRVQAIVNELQGEKIDIVNWSEVQSRYVMNALAPAEVAKVNEFPGSNKVEVVLPEDQLSIAIGRRGQNVKLASILTGLEIDILTEKEDTERRQAEFKTVTELFAEKLDLEDMIAQLLVVEGYNSVEKINNANVADIEKIEGFDEELAIEIHSRASQYVENEKLSLQKLIDESAVEEYLKTIDEFDNKILKILIDEKIMTRQDLADLSTDELIGKDGILYRKIDKAVAEKIIMDAREIYLD
ncbi:transcription termination factor NusA [Alphaproteobacteria bacterium]|nr:transcription termination factor NusA [Alphaproteobacteria bacterium]MDA9610581.1 transcription termination factor NusA [Alphaproteobacteria bacterium]MDB9824501.1 transcription termination factor NusA [Alphaproteobacteria bacterium]